MSTNNSLHDYQSRGIHFVTEELLKEERGGAALFMPPGMGKTRICLEVARVMPLLEEIKGVLIVAPLWVAYNSWPDEIEKWGYDIKYSIVHGYNKAKKLREPADLHIINPEGLAWLNKQKERPHWDLLVCDESGKFSGWVRQRSQAIRKLVPHIKKRVIATGTPRSQGMEGCFSQWWILDEGKEFGSSVTRFRSQWMTPIRTRYQIKWSISDRNEKIMRGKMQPKVFCLKDTDYLELPDVIEHNVDLRMPEKARGKYKDLEDTMFMMLDEANGQGLVASNAGALYVKCRQLANGSVFDEQRKAWEIHDTKARVVADLADDIATPLLVLYQFSHDVDVLQKHISGTSVIRGGMNKNKVRDILQAWNAGKIRVLLAQCQTVSHGLNMQHGGCEDLVWYGLTDQLEVYLQSNKRIHRQGAKTKCVRIHHLLMKDTVEQAMMARIQSKKRGQDAMLEALYEYRRKKNEV